MSKKDYRAIARIISDNLIGDYGTSIRTATFLIDLIAYLKQDNPLFDEAKFRDACRVE